MCNFDQFGEVRLGWDIYEKVMFTRWICIPLLGGYVGIPLNAIGTLDTVLNNASISDGFSILGIEFSRHSILGISILFSILGIENHGSSNITPSCNQSTFARL